MDIPRILDRLETRFDPQQKEKRNSQIEKEKKLDPKYPLDIVLCTNMISVGVDITRLGLMVMAGQPKTTAEYIQASSRVGRSFPGVVCTVFNWSRPRDLSHYERFEHYHDTFYQHVEALSVTPFSPRALDRGLTGTFVSLLRLQDEALNPEPAANKFNLRTNNLDSIQEAVRNRAENITCDLETGALVDDMLQERVDTWISLTNRPPAHLTYSTKKGNYLPLLSFPDKKNRSLFTCLNSLRDVEQSVNLILTVYDDKEEGEGNE